MLGALESVYRLLDVSDSVRPDRLQIVVETRITIEASIAHLSNRTRKMATPNRLRRGSIGGVHWRSHSCTRNQVKLKRSRIARTLSADLECIYRYIEASVRNQVFLFSLLKRIQMHRRFAVEHQSSRLVIGGEHNLAGF